MEYIVNLLHIWAALGVFVIIACTVGTHALSKNPEDLHKWCDLNASKKKRLMGKVRLSVCNMINIGGAIYLGVNGYMLSPVIMIMATVFFRALNKQVNDIKKLLVK